jgi:hypothetical protein
VEAMSDVLEKARVSPSMPNPGFAPPLEDLQRLLPDALNAARDWFANQRTDAAVGEPLLRVLAVLQKSGSAA